MHRLRVPHDIVALISKLHPDLKKKVKACLQAIISDPYSGKFLKDELVGLRSFRVSHFRIIYRFQGKREIEIVAIGPRKCIYEETFRIISKEESSKPD